MKYNAEHGYETCEKHGNYHYTKMRDKLPINETCPTCRLENIQSNKKKYNS